MCITFFWLADSKAGAAAASGYKLILFFNRDEDRQRKTEPAAWKDGVLAGRDLAEGKEGGTWLAIEGQSGKLGILTNIYTGGMSAASGVSGRGFLVMDYVKGTKEAKEYLDELDGSPLVYSPFNLVLFQPDVTSGSYSAHYYLRSSSPSGGKSEYSQLEAGTSHGLSNSPIDEPYLKTHGGRSKFEELLERQKFQTTEELLEQGFEMMSCTEQHYPDPVRAAQRDPKSLHRDEVEGRQLSSVFVELMLPNYGTRMQTAVLIDADDNVTFAERTRLSDKEEEEQDSRQIRWSPINKFQFKIQPTIRKQPE